MILAAHQSKYLPWLGLFHKIALATHFVAFDRVQYQKKNFLNKNFIKGVDGLPLRLSVPVMTSGKFDQLIAETQIDNRSSWARKHWRSIELAYKKAPYFDRYAAFFDATYNGEWNGLVDLNSHFMDFFFRELGIYVKRLDSQDYDFIGSGSELVLDMCRKLKASVYLSGEGGEDYVDREAFKECGIHLFFQKFNHPTYPQLHGKFLPAMSVIDLLFNCGPDSLSVIMSGNLSRADLPEFDFD